MATGPGSGAEVRGWRLLAARSVVVAYLLYVVQAIGQDSRGAGAVAGYAILAAFAVCWLVIPLPASPLFRGLPAWRFWAMYAVMLGLLAAELPFAHATAFVMAVLITVPAVARLGVRSAPSSWRSRRRRCSSRSRSRPGTTA